MRSSDHPPLNPPLPFNNHLYNTALAQMQLECFGIADLHYTAARVMSIPYLAQSDIIRMEACLRHRASSYDLPATMDAKCSEKEVLELEKHGF